MRWLPLLLASAAAPKAESPAARAARESWLAGQAQELAAVRALESEHAPSAAEAQAGGRAARSGASCWAELAVGGWNRSTAAYPATGMCTKKFYSKRPGDYAYAPLRRPLDVPTARLAAFCSVLRRRRVARVALIGDSIMTNQYVSLALLLGHGKHVMKNTQGWATRNLSSPARALMSQQHALMRVSCPEDSAAAPSGDPSTVLVRHVPATPYRLPGMPPAADDGTSMFMWRAALAAVRESDVSVINVGAHYSPELAARRRNESDVPAYPLAEQWAMLTRDLQAFAAGFRALAPRRRLVIWRTTAPGHPGCEEEWLPLSRWEQRNASAGRWAACPHCVDRLAWALFPAYDALARSLLEPLGVRVLDVSHMSAQRPDAHEECKYGGGKMAADCLHWVLPGVPDAWNALLLSSISECEGRRLPTSPAVAGWRRRS